MSGESKTEHAEVALTVKSFAFNASVQVSPAGLLAIAALVSGILLSTAVLVKIAKR